MTEYPYPTAFSHWDDAEHLAIQRVVKLGRFTQGEEVTAFEKEFAAFHGMKHGIMVNSGSSANLVMIAALFNRGDVKPGDKVLVPALAWSTTYAPLVQHGLDLILVDCDDGWNSDLYSLPRNLSEDVKLVVGCSILGNPSDLAGWKNAAGVLDAIFVEDNCESLGASVYTPISDANTVVRTKTGQRAGQLCGTFGLMSTFSFFYSHQVSAIEGGMILTNDDECAALCRMLRAHGWSRDVRPPKSFEEEYDFQYFGYNVRALEMHAAVAREQLKKLPSFIDARRLNLARFIEGTMGLPVLHPLLSGSPSPFGLHFEVHHEGTRARLVLALRAAGIDCRLPTGGSFTKHPYGRPWAKQETPNADRVHRCGLFLGNAPFDIGDKIDDAVEVMKAVL